MPDSCHARPVLIRAGQPLVKLGATRLGGSQPYNEKFIQDLVHDHPEIIPIADIEPAYMPLISICQELNVKNSSGDDLSLDNLWLTPAGGIILGECKLFRNQEARREVIAQALEYSAAIARLHYDELESKIRKARKSKNVALWDRVRDKSELNEERFVDAVERRLRQSRFMILIIGDGIREGVEALASHLQLHAGLHVSFAFVDLSVWRESDDWLVVVPRIPLRTVLIERGIVTIDSSGAPQIEAPRELAQQRSFTASEPEYFDQLEQQRHGIRKRVRSFLDSIEEIGIVAEYRRSLILRWDAGPDIKASAGYIDTSGRVWVADAANTARNLGNPAAGEKYAQSIAAMIGGRVERYKNGDLRVASAGGEMPKIDDLLNVADQWKNAIATLIEETRAIDQSSEQPGQALSLVQSRGMS